MNEYKKALLLDKVLAVCKKEEGDYSQNIAEKIQEDESTTGFLCEILETRQLVILADRSPIKSRGQKYFVRITNKGILFNDYEGGFKKQFWSNIKKKVWEFLKLVAIVANSVAVIYLTYISYDSQRQKDLRELQIQEQELIIKQKESEILRQKASSDSLLKAKQMELEKTQKRDNDRIEVLKAQIDHIGKIRL